MRLEALLVRPTRREERAARRSSIPSRLASVRRRRTSGGTAPRASSRRAWRRNGTFRSRAAMRQDPGVPSAAREQSQAAQAGLWRVGGLVFLIALAVRGLHLWFFRSASFFSLLVGDARAYDAWARRLAAGDWVGSEVFYQAPLYPYLLGVWYALVGPDLLTLRLLQIALGALACALVAVASGRLFGRNAGLAAGLLLAFYAPAIFFDLLVQKAVLDLLLVSLLLLLVSLLVERVGREALVLGRRRAWAPRAQPGERARPPAGLADLDRVSRPAPPRTGAPLRRWGRCGPRAGRRAQLPDRRRAAAHDRAARPQPLHRKSRRGDRELRAAAAGAGRRELRTPRCGRARRGGERAGAHLRRSLALLARARHGLDPGPSRPLAGAPGAQAPARLERRGGHGHGGSRDARRGLATAALARPGSPFRPARAARSARPLVEPGARARALGAARLDRRLHREPGRLLRGGPLPPAAGPDARALRRPRPGPTPGEVAARPSGRAAPGRPDSRRRRPGRESAAPAAPCGRLR